MTGEPTIRHQRMWDYVRNYLGLQVNLLRLGKGWSVEELARRSNVSVSVILAIEDGDLLKATPKSLARIADAFDVAVLLKFESYLAYVPPNYDEETKTTVSKEDKG